MDFLNDIFDLLSFSEMQKQDALKDFELAVQKKILNDLISELPAEASKRIKNINSAREVGCEKEIGTILKSHFPIERIKEEQLKAFALLSLQYIDFMFKEADVDQKQKLKNIFVKYDIALPQN
jgi:hypothetical protein